MVTITGTSQRHYLQKRRPDGVLRFLLWPDIAHTPLSTIDYKYLNIIAHKMRTETVTIINNRAESINK